MPVAPDSIALEHHSADAAAELLDELCEAYADAYGVDPKENKADAFRSRAEGALGAKNFDLVTARQGDELIGFVFGYSLRADRGWWDGLDPEPPPGFAHETGTRTAVLAEIEVRRAWQGKGVGTALQKEFLNSR
jgi:GNAT superfamily N-acetyltransferase